MKRMIKASSCAEWQDEIFDGEHWYELETPKGKGTVSSFDNDGDWGYNVRIDVAEMPTPGGIRKSFRGKNSKFEAMEYVENVLCKTKVAAAYEDEDDDEYDLGEATVNAWFKALSQSGLEEEDIHCLSYKEVSDFKKILERELNNRRVSLPQQSLVIPQRGEGTQIEGLKIGGNVSGIADSLVRGVIKKAWEPVPKDEAAEIVEDAVDLDNAIYIQDKFGYCTPASAQQALKLVGAGDETKYSGQGSQQYIDDIKVTVYQDYFGNVKVARTLQRWD